MGMVNNKFNGLKMKKLLCLCCLLVGCEPATQVLLKHYGANGRPSKIAVRYERSYNAAYLVAREWCLGDVIPQKEEWIYGQTYVISFECLY